MDLSGLGQGLLAGSCERGNEILVPYNAGKLLVSLTTSSSSSRALLHGHSSYYNSRNIYLNW